MSMDPECCREHGAPPLRGPLIIRSESDSILYQDSISMIKNIQYTSINEAPGRTGCGPVSIFQVFPCIFA